VFCRRLAATREPARCRLATNLCLVTPRPSTRLHTGGTAGGCRCRWKKKRCLCGAPEPAPSTAGCASRVARSLEHDQDLRAASAKHPACLL
jgi:hypothetical protein